MKKFIITEEQANFILTQLGELPAKFVNVSINILQSLQPLPEVKEEKQPTKNTDE